MKGEGKSSKRSMKLSMTWTGIAVLLVSIALMLFAVTPVIAQEAKVSVTVNAPPEVEKGGTFVATIDVDSVTDFSLAQFDLSFDHDVIKVSDVKDGEINGEEIPIYMWRFMDADTVRVAIRMEPVGEKCVSGSGYLAEIKLDVEGKEGEESKLDISNAKLGNVCAEKIPANWINATITIREEEDSDEEPPDIIACEPTEVVVSSTEGEVIAFEITVDQIVDVSWQINGTEVQTDESVTEAVYTNTSAVVGIWNVSAIATNRATDLSIMHTWIWDVTPTSTAEPGVTPSPTLEPGVTPSSTLAPEVTPLPTTTPTVKPTPKPTAPPTTEEKPKPTPEVPGFEAIFAIAVMSAVAYILLRKR